MGLFLGLRFGWLDWVAAKEHPVRNVLEAMSWIFTGCGFFLMLPPVQRFLGLHSGQVDERDLLDNLADATEKHWAREAELRRVRHGPLPVRWCLAKRNVAPGIQSAIADGARGRFAPLPGTHRVTQADLRDGGELPELYNVYGGLASGRLLLTGEGASGKTTAGILLLLEVLAQRKGVTDGDKRADLPVPVLLELRDWKPQDESVIDWVARSLSQSERLVRGRAGRGWVREMLRAARISVFLDGFDEVDAKVRRVMVTDLNEAPFRLVVLSRTKEARQTASRSPLSSALGLALQEVLPADATAYLQRRDLPEPPPPAWRAVIDELDTSPEGPLATALRYPLAVGLLRDAYTDDDPVDELLDRERFPTADAIQDRLLDQVVKTAYRPRRGRSRYSVEAAERTLRFIADRLVAQGTYDLAWWHIPSWVSPLPRAVVAGIIAGAVTGPVAIAAHGIGWGLTIGIINLMAVALWTARDREGAPLDTAGWRDIFHWGTLRIGLFVGGFNLVVLLPIWGKTAIGLVYVFCSAFISALVTTVMVSPAADLVAGLPHEQIARIFGVTRSDTAELGRRATPAAQTPRAVGPREVWRHHAYWRFAFGLFIGGAIGIWFGLITVMGTQADSMTVFLHGLTTAIAFGSFCGVAGNTAIMTIVSFVHLALTKAIPIRLLSFLEDARRRNLIRVSGQVYQFRHTALRDRLSHRAT
ncbi:NACHT domain-containing protein [Lentzea atacamensis]|uniref:hypothetical protein n=1 Tax=Lentzea atacamensis TaxID=531938 RepID=UPI0011B71D6C|nr:hypothetical protein [Lentzea atacamensis]